MSNVLNLLILFLFRAPRKNELVLNIIHSSSAVLNWPLAEQNRLWRKRAITGEIKKRGSFKIITAFGLSIFNLKLARMYIINKRQEKKI